jgi:predicted lipoprotein with Yx(FWY)xxD motif
MLLLRDPREVTGMKATLAIPVTGMKATLAIPVTGTKATLAILLAGAALALGSPAWSQDPPAPLKAAKAGNLGTILVGPGGMTVYTFASDKGDGKSACTGSCARKWPPVAPAAGAPAVKPPLSVIVRDDGSKQYAWKGKPLYYYADDKKPGDTTGHEVGRSWFVVVLP